MMNYYRPIASSAPSTTPVRLVEIIPYARLSGPEPDSCLSICTGNINDKNWTITNVDKSIRTPLSESYTSIDDRDKQLIQPEELTKLFSMKNDPCNRSATVLVGNELLNMGPQACRMEFVLPGADARIRIDVPVLFKGSLRREQGSIQLIFDNSEYRPTLKVLKRDKEELAPLTGCGKN